LESQEWDEGVPPEIAQLFVAEDRHFWFQARNRVLARVVSQLVEGLADGFRVLEVGCGNGNVLRVLEDVCTRGEVIGADLMPQRLQFARRRTRCRLIQADLHELPFEQPFDLIGLFDVLEHLPDDRRALVDLKSALSPEGALVLTVPAHMALWSYADTFAGHYRRYSPTQLKRALTEAGFQVDYLTQFMMVLTPLMWLARRMAALWKRTGAVAESQRELVVKELRTVPVVNGVLRYLLEREAPLIARRRRLPIGASLLAIARPHQ
jgi:SAM-dependent methyltransferase